MSRSCHSATFSSAACAWPRITRASPRHALAHDRVPLVRHRARALLARGERLLDLADLGPGEVPDLGGDRVERGGADRERRHVLGVPVALDHLRARASAGRSPSRAHTSSSTRGSTLRVRADHPADRADAHGLARAPQALAIAIELERPHRELVAERGRLGVDPVRTARCITVSRCASAWRFTTASSRSSRASSRSAAARSCSAKRGVEHVATRSSRSGSSGPRGRPRPPRRRRRPRRRGG